MLSYAPSHIGCPATISVRYRVLTDEELKEVTGGLVQLINPSSKCREYSNEKDCEVHKFCRWWSDAKSGDKKCITVY